MSQSNIWMNNCQIKHLPRLQMHTYLQNHRTQMAAPKTDTNLMSNKTGRHKNSSISSFNYKKEKKNREPKVA